MALIGLFVGIFFAVLKMHSFSWGEYELNIWGDAVTINSYWYYSLLNISHAGFAGAIACVFTYLSEINKHSYISFICKYVSIIIALVAGSRCIFGIIFYCNITIFEELFFVLLLIYTTFRGLIYYRNNLKVDGKQLTA
jgi:hypothetical protein